MFFKGRRFQKVTWLGLLVLFFLIISSTVAQSPRIENTLTTSGISFELWFGISSNNRFQGNIKFTFLARAFDTETKQTLTFDNVTIHILKGSVSYFTLMDVREKLDEAIYTTKISYDKYISGGYLPESEFKDEYVEKPYYNWIWNSCRYPNSKYTIFLFVWLGSYYQFESIYFSILNDDLSQFFGFYIPFEVQMQTLFIFNLIFSFLLIIMCLRRKKTTLAFLIIIIDIAITLVKVLFDYSVNIRSAGLFIASDYVFFVAFRDLFILGCYLALILRTYKWLNKKKPKNFPPKMKTSIDLGGLKKLVEEV